MQSFFDQYDAYLLPTVAVPPFERGQWKPDTVAGEPIERDPGWTLTPLFELPGYPAASVPAGFTDDGLPVGMQSVESRFADDLVLAISGAFERIRPWYDVYDRLPVCEPRPGRRPAGGSPADEIGLPELVVRQQLIGGSLFAHRPFREQVAVIRTL